MKTFLSLTLIFLSLAGRAQTHDTLFTNEHHNVALFFPDKIRQAVVGAENYIFSYNQEHPQFFGLLKGTPGKTSNLFAITQDGHVYSYTLAYREELRQVVYFLEKKESLGKENKQLIPDTSSTKPSTNQKNIGVSSGINNQLENWAKHFHRMATGTLKEKKKDRISLQINEFIYKEEEVYFVMEISNNSGIDFETEYLRIFVSQGNKKRNSSYQKILQQPIMKYNFPQKIEHGERKRLVYVLPKFTVGDKERLEIELRERNGNRFVRLRFKK